MTTSTTPEPKRIALVAHDGKKDDLLEWAEYNRDLLAGHILYATGTTGRLLSEALDLPVTRFQSGPLGGDQQIGALIAAGELDMLVFFWDPMSSQPHDSDVKALVRLAVRVGHPDRLQPHQRRLSHHLAAARQVTVGPRAAGSPAAPSQRFQPHLPGG